MLRTGLYILNGLPAPKGVKKGEVNPRPAGVLVPILIGIICAVFVTINLTSGLTVAMCVVTPFVLAILVAGGVILNGYAEVYGGSRSIKAMPSAPTTADQQRTTAQMRARASEVRSTVPATPKPPTAVSVPLQRVQEDTAAITTVRERVDERLMRVAALLVVSCPFCGAGEGASCELIGDKMYLIDNDRGISVHLLRIIKAVSTGAARLDDVTAQFDGHTPEELWGAFV